MSKPEKVKVLYIDDEPNNLVGFKATFRLDYNVLVANSAEEGFEMLEKHSDIKVILCDQRMPNKTGVQFFEEITPKYPAPVRMLLTGYTDIESVINAINKGHIYRYITKPWQETDIRSAIEEGYKYFVTTSMLNVKNEELQKAYDELDKFAYSVTHDMRGPILSSLGAIELAKGSDDIGEIKEVLGMMEKSLHRMDAFIQNMHEYYNIKRGELQIKEINLTEITEELNELFTMGAKVEQTRFSINLQQDSPFRSDELTLKIILNNLLSNAFKYQRKNNDSKFVELDVNVSAGRATVYVRDNGIGIDEAHINDIFNMFYRATSESVGSGFGLYNVKDALRKLNGTIRVSSKPNEGTEFIVEIPSK
ncbi:MAG TPA: hybrid sensor histidine kinase/response regulator [Flavipsychrobacter sp.]|nr:hybrid sensor histidine kinase/response regulator [Flavipsychrobacter sp.]